jgi:hypothetical protein
MFDFEIWELAVYLMAVGGVVLLAWVWICEAISNQGTRE